MSNKLMVDLKVGETLVIGTSSVRLVKKSGQLARLEVKANRDTVIIPPRARGKHDSAQECAPKKDMEHNHGQHAI